ncbi:MAG TPA: D-aminoacyl-tRNA deacylase [Candidatus Baltobacteraceae bacterium]|nr:D-aminoacyl-tRNA deacylase [Candidatus Baltobacteraceae bacterium]
MATTLVYSTADPVSSGVAKVLKGMTEFSRDGEIGGHPRFVSNMVTMIEMDVPLFMAEGIDKLVGGTIVFISKHASVGGIGSFTVHPTGNWRAAADFGGEPLRLSRSSPLHMLSLLKSLGGTVPESTTYEATHHGPLTESPSLFVELGGNPAFAASTDNHRFLASAILKSLNGDFKVEYGEVAVGIGGTHYPRKFTKLALEGKYAFGHIMPNYALAPDMIAQAVEMSDLEVEKAVVEWKSIKAADRELITRRLEELGIDYDRV